MMPHEKETLMEEILKIEWWMFTTVNASSRQHTLENSDEPGGPPRAACQDCPEEFRLQRISIFQTWSDKTLQSYLEDLKRADAAGQNLMTVKYARMDNLIPRSNESPLIEKITVAKVAWQKAFIDQYPGIMSKGRALKGEAVGVDWASFQTYTRSELETYSEETLQYLYEDVERFKCSGANMSEAVYSNLIRAKGYDSLNAAEAAMRASHYREESNRE